MKMNFERKLGWENEVKRLSDEIIEIFKFFWIGKYEFRVYSLGIFFMMTCWKFVSFFLKKSFPRKNK